MIRIKEVYGILYHQIKKFLSTVLFVYVAVVSKLCCLDTHSSTISPLISALCMVLKKSPIAKLFDLQVHGHIDVARRKGLLCCYVDNQVQF